MQQVLDIRAIIVRLILVVVKTSARGRVSTN